MKRGRVAKEQRRENALILEEERTKRTDRQQLNRLDKLFGKNKGAKKERAKLKSRIKKGKNK